jgi:hypothetical protein
MTTSNITMFSVQKCAARTLRGRITDIATKPGEKSTRKTWFLGDKNSRDKNRILDLFSFLSFPR